MKLSSFKYSILAAFILASCKTQPTLESDLEGFHVSKEKLQNDFTAFSSAPTQMELASYLRYETTNSSKGKRKVNKIAFYYLPERPKPGTKLTDQQIEEAFSLFAGDFLKVSSCFQIDPYFFVGLIQKESQYFDPEAQSPTGAVGLSQMTTSGLKEVSHQLGIPKAIDDSSFASKDAVKFYTDLIRECFDADWHPLWDKTPSYYRQLSVIKRNPKIALIYGGLLLHEKLALVLKGRVKNPDNSYRKAFNKYNASSAAQQRAHEKGSVGFAHKLVAFVNARRKNIAEENLDEDDFEGLPLVTQLTATGRSFKQMEKYDPHAVVNYLDRNSEVRELQLLLKLRNFIKKIDGVYGMDSARAVCKYFYSLMDEVAVGCTESEAPHEFCDTGKRVFENPYKGFCEAAWAIDADEWNRFQIFDKTDIKKIARKHRIRDIPLDWYKTGDVFPLHYDDGSSRGRPEMKPYVKFVQALLRHRGHRVGVDGHYGPGTRRVLLEYLADHQVYRHSLNTKHSAVREGKMITRDIFQYILLGKIRLEASSYKKNRESESSKVQETKQVDHKKSPEDQKPKESSQQSDSDNNHGFYDPDDFGG